MKRFSEQLQKKAASISLTASERADLRVRIEAFMEYHPMPVSAKVTTPAKIAVMPAFKVIQIPATYWRSFAGVFALLLVIGVPALAERAVPGDILYPIKVQVTEEIRGSLNLDPYAKVAWETTRLERRIAEARLLAKAGKLTPEVEAGVLAAVESQKVTTESEIETLRTTDAEGASLAQLTFATMLGVQSSVLRADDSASTTMGMSTVALATALDASLADVNEKGDPSDVSVTRLQAQLELETTRSYELLQDISPIATEQEQKDIERRLSDLERKIAFGTDATSGDDASHKAALRSAWSDVQKLISFMTDIDVRASLAIETLVPIVLTDTERVAKVIHQTEIATVNLARVEKGLADITEAAIAEKITLSVPHVTELLVTASTSLRSNLPAAEAAATEAVALTDSMLALATFPTVTEAEVAAPIAGTSTVPVVEVTASTTATSSTAAASTTTPIPTAAPASTLKKMLPKISF